MSDHMNQMTPAATLLSREVIEAKDTGEVRVRFLAKHDFTNRHGTVQGGFLAAMLDSATGNALMAMLPPEQTAVHTRLDISFLKPARPGPLTAVARVIERDARSAKVEAEISDDAGTVLATARAELRLLPRVR
jgi:uncharacterized protein (TIGR00369 family)